MSLVPWKSFGIVPKSRVRARDEFSSFQKEMNNLMNVFFNRGDLSYAPLVDNDYFPTIDITEKGNKYLLDADVPGMSEKDIDIDFRNNTLTIKGEKKSETETQDAGYVCVERSYGSFRRDIPFDDEIDQDQIKADLKNGVLHVELLKKDSAGATHKKIAIKH